MAGPPVTGEPVPTLALGQFVADTGIFPEPGGNGPASYTMAMIHSFAGTPQGWVPFPYNMPQAHGQTRLTQGHEALFSVIGTAYGGDGAKTFCLPGLKGLSPSNRLPPNYPAPPAPGTAPVQWLIAAEGTKRPPTPVPIQPHFPPGFPPPPPMPPLPPVPKPALLQAGMLAMFTGDSVPAGWLACDGSVIDAAQYPELCAVIDNAFGWLPGGGMALPQLDERVIVGPPPGIVPGQTRPYWPGDAWQSVPQSLCLNWLICVTGAYPAAGSQFNPNAGFLGQVVAYAGKDVPDGWAACDGSLIQIGANEELFVLLGSTYGGDGITNFAVPDLRGTAMVGA